MLEGLMLQAHTHFLCLDCLMCRNTGDAPLPSCPAGEFPAPLSSRSLALAPPAALGQEHRHG